MRIEKDFLDLVKEFNKNKVKYCIVGAYAVIFHTRPRYTEDIDIYVEPSEKNAKRTIKALKDFGSPLLSFSEKDVVEQKEMFQIGIPPVSVHIMSKVIGLNNEQVWESVVKNKYGNETAYYLGIEQVIKTKVASSESAVNIKRGQDKLDLETIEKYHKATYDKVMAEIQNSENTLKELSTDYNTFNIRNETVLNSVKGSPMEKQLEVDMKAVSVIIEKRANLTSDDKRRIATVLSSRKCEKIWLNTNLNPEVKVAVGEMIIKPTNKKHILKEFNKEDKELIESNYNILTIINSQKDSFG